MQHEGNLYHAFVDRFRLGRDELLYEGQAGGHMHIRAADMQVGQNNIEKIPPGRIDLIQVAVVPGQIEQGMQKPGSQHGIFREAQFDIIRDPGGLSAGQAKAGE